MVLESLFEAMAYFGNPVFLLMMLAGVIAGLIIGIIPGIGGIVGVAVFLPFLFRMLPEHGLPFIIALISVTFTSGAITTILLGVPGTGPNAATLIDGYPMAERGEAGRGIGAALTASGLGGVLSAFLALGMIPLVIPLIMALRLGDMVFIVLLGLAFIGVLAGRSVLKGLISGGLGLLISFIGYQSISAAERFTFGSLYLYDGVPLVPLVVGLFAIPAMVDLAVRGGTIAKTPVVMHGGLGEVVEGMRDVFRRWQLWLRSSVIGYIIGVVPGVGAEVATFVCYGQAKQFSKNPEKFGTGIVDGVIAPESANNGKEGGALLTTLALGIPGSGVMVLVIGAIRMTGLTPGPEMLTTHLPISLSLLLVTVVANILAVIICFPLSSKLVRIALVPSAVLLPIVVTIALVGAYATRGYFNAITVALIFGVVGIVMRRHGFSRPGMLLGYVLGYLFEYNLWLSLATAGPTFFLTPISLFLITLFVAIISLNPLRRLIARRKAATKQ